MAEQSQSKPPDPQNADEARDLRNTLLFGGLGVLSFGVMILASGPVLQIPPLETSLAALSGAAVTLGGLLALQLNWPVRRVAWGVLVAYAVVVSLAVHYTGGPLTPMPALYLLVVVASSFLLDRPGATVIAAISAVCYAIMLFLEYSGCLSMVPIWRLTFDPQGRGQLLIVNWLVVSIAAVLTAQLAGRLAERLKGTNVRLRESERLRENLTQMIVHDMRNPLVALMGWLDLFQSNKMTEADGVQVLLLENARRSGQVLLDMVSELLDISKMEAGRLNLKLEAVDLCELIAENIDSVRAVTEIEELEVRVEYCEDRAIVACDRHLISRVLSNLLSNAIKHTPLGGTITLAARRQGDGVQVSVADNGIGIPLEYQQRIFEKFAQAQLLGRERRGTGLGLTFCKMAVEAHGGRIWVESQVGEGSTFLFTLPAGQLPGNR